MGEEKSETDENLFLLEGLETFHTHALRLISKTRRNLTILSENLDFTLYNRHDIAKAISDIARKDRNSTIRILVKDTRAIVERNHLLLNLSRKLPSKISIRKLEIEPDDKTRAYLIGDLDLLLYKHDELEYAGFSNYSAGPEVRNILEDFNYLWQRHSIEDANLRNLLL